MTTQAVQIFRETTLPVTLIPYSIYMIAPLGVSNVDYVEMYVTDAFGNAKRNVNRADIASMIASAGVAATPIDDIIIYSWLMAD